MNPRDFLLVAEDLLEASREADWRTAISRAYYAAYLVAVALFRDASFEVPPDTKGHNHVYVRLNNCGRAEVIEAAVLLRELRDWRNLADYVMHRRLDLRDAIEQVDAAREIIRLLDELKATPVILAQVVQTMRDYERDVLGDVTFRGP
jgi:uncharacterized protein (UPF0332 family)